MHTIGQLTMIREGHKFVGSGYTYPSRAKGLRHTDRMNQRRTTRQPPQKPSKVGTDIKDLEWMLRLYPGRGFFVALRLSRLIFDTKDSNVIIVRTYSSSQVRQLLEASR